ncbi:MAG: DNA polymerase III subunit alpha [Bacteroidetes bacterium]|nr:MAG: DNA polymerase III subunit alpha [Bacteroidota bacterium]
MFLIFDVETTGKAIRYDAPIEDLDNWPRVVQIAWQLHDETGKLINRNNIIVKPEGFEIPFAVAQIHGITTERALKEGIPLNEALSVFEEDLRQAQYVIGHNIADFDIKVVAAEHIRSNFKSSLPEKQPVDTMTTTIEFCAIPGGRGGGFKYPSLLELHEKLFGEKFDAAHDAAYDVHANARSFFELLKRKVITLPELAHPENISYEAPVLEQSNFQASEKQKKETGKSKKHTGKISEELDKAPFAHLHNHTQFTTLQATTTVDDLVNKAAEEKMPAVAITDNGNMMGAFIFSRAVKEINKKFQKEESDYHLKPIIGCELNVCRNRLDKTIKDNGYQIVFLAKNKNGYHNLAKLSSIGYLEGYYYVPRVDKEVIAQYKEDLIVLTGGMQGELARKILYEGGESEAEKALLWWKEQFGDDLYIELFHHNTGDLEAEANRVLLKLAKKHQIKTVATNNTYYLNKEDAKIHDIFLCIKEGNTLDMPIGKGRGHRFGFPNDQFYFKSATEMKQAFASEPEAILNIEEIIGKIEEYDLENKVLLPKFDIPDEFKHPDDEKDGGKRGENAYLRHLTYEGAKKRYKEITPEIKERLDFELEIIEKTGYPGYFLIVQDFTNKAREMGVSVGPGRGSAAGSAVAYCIGITNVDPIEYDLLFERFLNPDRISLPDIDIDFDDEGRKLVIDYVIDKYGKDQVAQIITYGLMKAKSSIKDVCRVMGFEPSESDYLTKLLPDISLSKLFSLNEKELKEKLNDDKVFQNVKRFLELANGNGKEAEAIKYARIVEGSLRNLGVHACGVIISPLPLTEVAPMAIAKDSDLMVTQYDNAVVESAGMLKMDFLGLKTLSLIKETLKIIKALHNKEIDIDKISLDDPKTYQIFQRGETVGIFQYESVGMQKSLKQLKPDKFADLIAMNALYRPGPLQYIPNFIRRKHGQEEITYDLPDMKEYLEETYGITVYQEQVMLLSQKLAGFTKGQADALRKGMGKKKKEILDELYPKFIEGGLANGHPKDKLEKIWKDWEAFAAYAFNKSHSTCYAYVAFQTAYLKAHYPAEYMASVLSYNMEIDKLRFFMKECKRMKINVLGPSINESFKRFGVNKKGEIRFGLAAIKGVGDAAVENIIEERKKNGPFKSIYDFVSRVDLKSVNKKTMENLVLAGAFDEFTDGRRSIFFAPTKENHSEIFLETLIKYGNAVQSAQEAPPDLFGEQHAIQIPEPEIPHTEDWPLPLKLKKEQEVIGLYLSGHPLDNFEFEYEQFCNIRLSQLENPEKLLNKELRIGGYVVNAEERVSKRGNLFGDLTISDYYGEYRIMLFSETYLKFRHFVHKGNFLFIRGKFEKKVLKKTNEEKIDFKVIEIDDMSKKKKKMVKGINIKLDVNEIDENLVDELFYSIEENQGKCMLSIFIHDDELKTPVILPSKSKKVKISDNLLNFFKENNIDYSIKT